MYKYDQNAHFTMRNVIYFRKLPITSGVNVLKAIKMHNSTDLCILKVIIYRILQLPQFFLLFLLFLFLLLSQSSFSLIIIIILKFLNITRQNTTLKVGALQFRMCGSLQHQACHRHWSSRAFMFWYLPVQCEMHVSTFCTFCLLKSFKSLGNSFDMLDQYTDRQSLEALHACSTKMVNNAISNIFIDCVRTDFFVYILCMYNLT